MVNGNFSVTCSKCGHVNDFDASESDFEQTGTEEKGMGVQKQYTWEITFDCDGCGNEIEVVYDVWEYPTGAYNDSDIQVSGGTATGEFGYDFIGEPDPEEPDED